MRVDVAPTTVDLTPGTPAAITIAVTNTADIISGYGVRILGADPSWVELDRDALSLFPGTTDMVLATIAIPPTVPAGTRRIAVQVSERTGTERTVVTELDIVVPAAPRAAVRVEPTTVTGGRRAAFTAAVENNGNTRVNAELAGLDPEDKLWFRFRPALVDLPPGQRRNVEVTVGGRRRLVGNPTVRPFEVFLDPVAPRPGDEPPLPAAATFVQKAWVGRATLGLVGLLAAITVFATVITIAFTGVVQRSAADRDLALQIAQARAGGGSGGSSSIAGQVLLLTSGAPVAGVTVEVFDASDTANVLATTATSDDGAYELAGLPQASYKLRFRGAGFAEVWYPGVASDSDAGEVPLQPGEAATGIDVTLGGLPASIAGTLVGTDVSGATVSLQVPLDDDDTGAAGADSVPAPGATDVASGAQFTSTVVGADGAFTIGDIPSPSTYDLVVRKPGFAIEVQRVDLGAGEDRTGIEIRLRDGDGLVAGRVAGPSGPVGGATVSATYGSTTVRTVSLTEGDVGAFTLRGLPTPGLFTVVVASPGLASTTMTLSLGAGQQLTGVTATLGTASGGVHGVVRTLPDNRPAGGVSVTVTDGRTTVRTVTQSTGDVGAWAVAGLPIPSVYTITFERPDLAAQTISVSLDARGVMSGHPGDEGLVTTLVAATAALTGTVTQDVEGGGGVNVGNADVELASTSGDVTYHVSTASTPADQVGTYVLHDIPPGTYTLTISHRGTTPTVLPLTLAAGDARVVDVRLVESAAIFGTVLDDTGQPPVGVEVRLYRAVGDYPVGDPVQVVTPDADGGYEFANLDAPEWYLVEVADATTGESLATSFPYELEPSQQLQVDVTIPTSDPTPPPADRRGVPALVTVAAAVWWPR